MANKKVVFALGSGAVVITALLLFASGDSRPKANKSQNPSKVADTKAQKPGISAEERKKRKQARQARKREAFLKRWAKMTPEQRAAFMKKHPNFKPPANAPAPAATSTTPTAAPAKKTN